MNFPPKISNITEVRYKATSTKLSPDSRNSYDVSETISGLDACTNVGIDKLGITGPTTLYHNLTFQELFDHEVANEEGEIASAEYGDTFTVDTGKFTGRSPKDKWIVLNKDTESEKISIGAQ